MTASSPIADVALRDGSTVRVRAVRPDDEPELRSLLDRLSPDSLFLRFFTAGANLDRKASWAATLGGGRGYGVVATLGVPERIVGHAAYVHETPERAELAFEVEETMHGLGIATILLAHLAEAAQRDGVRTFTATVHPSNHRMASVLRDSGFRVDVDVRPGELHYELPASLDAAAIAAFEDRDRMAAISAVAHVLSPHSVALIGPSRHEGTVGAAVLGNLIAAGFRGPVQLVHPHADELAGLPVHRRIADVPGPVELAVIAVPAHAVVEAARECGAAGVKALTVLSSDFAETGHAGRRRQAELLEACRASGMRLVGPNCLGVLNTRIGLNATFAPQVPKRGGIAFASQSGAFGILAIAEATRRGLGLSSFASMGNKADLSGNDFLRYWDADLSTDVILLYLESFGNPRRFGQIARSVAARKPIVAVKSGRSAAGARAASSHTGALLAASDVTVDALFAHAGVIRTDTVTEQLDVAALLASQPLPAGDRVAIVTNAGGPGIACADACAAAGLRVEPNTHALQRGLRHGLPAQAAVGNPVDMIASAGGDDYRRTIELLDADDGVDSIITIFIPPLLTQADEVAASIRAATRRKPLLAVFMATSDAERAALAGDGEIPVYGTPEEAVRALGHAVRYADWRRRLSDDPPTLDAIDADAVDALLARALARGEGWLEPEEVDVVLAAYGIPLIETRRVNTAAEAGAAAAELGGRVAVKAIAPGLIHKSDAGGVALGVRGEAETSRAARRIAAAVRATGHDPGGFLVQRMAPDGVELLVGIVGDPDFGPVVACGAGGRAVELLGDAGVRLAPLGRRDAAELLRSLRTFQLLDGYRGAPAADVAAVEDVLLRVSALGAAHPQIAELDCNPLLASPDGAVVLDARIPRPPAATAAAVPRPRPVTFHVYVHDSPDVRRAGARERTSMTTSIDTLADTSLRELIDLDGRTAIVTGGAMGIGLGIARRLHEAGARIVIADVDPAAGAAAAAALEDQRPGSAFAVATDVSDEAAVETLVEATVERFGAIDILVNNAGIYPFVTEQQITPETFRRVLEINLVGLHLCTQAAARRMIEAGRGGAIVNVTSIDALHPSSIGLAHYDASKHGAWGYTKNVALELCEHGIRVNAIAPGAIATPGTEPGGEASEDLKALVEATVARIPMCRMGDPDEIGRAALFLASELSSYMTGSQVVVDGGMLLR